MMNGTCKIAKLLILDDEVELMTALTDILNSQGYEATGFSNGRDAIQALKKECFDIVLTDLMMPEMDGISFLHAAKEIDSNLVGIIMTGQGTVHTAVESMKMGAFDYILKPFKLPNLLPVLYRAMDTRRLRLENIQLQEAVEIYELSMAMAYSQDSRMILNKTLDAAIKQCHADEGSIMLPTNDDKELYVAVVRGDGRENIMGERIPMGQKVAGWVASHQESVSIEGCAEDERFRFIRPRTDILRSLSIPIIIGGKIIGILNINFKKEVRPLSLGQIKSLNILLNIAGTALQNTRLNDEIKKMESQLYQAQKMEAIGVLAGGIAHDFNNILFAIMGYAQMAEKKAPAEIGEYLHEVLTACNRAKDLIGQILTFSRHTDEEKTSVSLDALIKETLRMIRASLPANVEIKSNISAKKGTVMASFSQMHQVLVNLCTNAGYAMHDTGGILNIDLKEIMISDSEATSDLEIYPGPHLMLTVSDTGCGIDKETIDKIFDPFFTTKPKGEGTGMGLAVVHGIIKSHGGKITVSSEPGKGTTFSILLRKLETKVDESNEKMAKKKIMGGDERILLVDDEAVLSKMQGKILTGLGYKVTTQTQPVAALELFRSDPNGYDLVITDMSMPRMSGMEFAEEIHTIRPDMSVIILSGFIPEIDQEKTRAIGIRNFIQKPASVEHMADSIREALALKGESPCVQPKG
ncbi:MAG: response regulator [Desulfobacteraceae bacterium]|jgi:signal transduction histidine kinase/DNA-binding response OmpR family regulator